MTRKLTVITWADQYGPHCYHIEVDQSVVDLGVEAIEAEVPMHHEPYEWISAVFDGHITCILSDPDELPLLNF